MADDYSWYDDAGLASASLTDAEHRALGLTGELVKLMKVEILGNGRTRRGDLREFLADVHRIQNQILSQAAARAYPDRYRLLGADGWRAKPAATVDGAAPSTESNDPDWRPVP